MATSVRLARLVTRRAAIDHLLTSPAGPVWRDSLRRGIRVQNLARTYVRVDTGTLRASIGVWQRIQGQKIITGVGSNIEYAPYVGTRAGPHGNCVRCHGAYLTDALNEVV
jgi:hypothetical protein